VLKKTVLDLPIPVEEEPKKKKKDKAETVETAKAPEEAKPEEPKTEADLKSEEKE
jgi:hypothetical protein